MILALDFETKQRECTPEEQKEEVPELMIQGLPSDYISRTVGHNWKEYRGDEQVIIDTNKYFSEIQNDVDVREYHANKHGTNIDGVSRTKIHMWQGEYCVGKSLTLNLMKHMLGDYF